MIRTSFATTLAVAVLLAVGSAAADDWNGPQPVERPGDASSIGGTWDTGAIDLAQTGPATTTCALAPRIVADVQGPAASGLGAVTHTPDHHVMVIENTHATTSSTATDDHNTDGLAIVLHSYGNDDDLSDMFDELAIPWLQFSSDFYPAQDPPHVTNTINRNDHFLTFYRQNEDGSQDVVGRIEGISFWDLAEIDNDLIAQYGGQGYMPMDMFEFDITYNPDWVQWDPPSLSHSGASPTFSGGSLPWLRFNNLNCEHNGGTEVCIDLGAFGPEIDLTFDPGSTPSIGWGYLDDPFMGLSLDVGSLDLSAPFTFGSPFFRFDPLMVEARADQAYDQFGALAPLALEMKSDPVGFLAKYAFSLRGGVTYESGSGDYAEWLERLDADEALEIADIVGVYGGKITRRTDGADQVMVVSYKPIVLGNTPPEDRTTEFEKVAFMGQTLVKVRGRVAEGDYVLPSGLEDGFGRAVAPDAIEAADLGSVVGVAWGAGGRPGMPGVVNVAVGLRPGEVSRVVARQENRIESLERDLDVLRAQVARLAAGVDR